MRNRWAHNETFTPAEAYRAVETAELLLRAVGADTAATQAARVKTPLRPTMESPPLPNRRQPRRKPAKRRLSENQAPTADGSPPQPQAPAPRIEIHAVSDLSYAMAHCRVPVIDHITVDNTGNEVHGAVVEVDVVSTAGSTVGPERCTSTSLPTSRQSCATLI